MASLGNTLPRHQPSRPCCRPPPKKRLIDQKWGLSVKPTKKSQASKGIFDRRRYRATFSALEVVALNGLSSTSPQILKGVLWLAGRCLMRKQACNIPGWDFPKHLKELGTQVPLKVLSSWPLRQSWKSHPKSWPIQFSQPNHDKVNGKTDSWWWWWCV